MSSGCEHSYFNNCGPIKEGDDQCIFHKVTKTKSERREFYEELKDLEYVREETDAALGGLGMSTHTRFVFEDHIDFRGYHFPKVPLEKPSSLAFGFGRAIFEGTADFSHASFYMPVFSGAIFKSDVLFAGATFFEAEFDQTVFHGSADFRGAIFEGTVSFHLASFYGPARFLTANFDARANFSVTSFEDECLFIGASFDSSLSFSNTEFHRGITILPVNGEYIQSGPIRVDVDEQDRFQQDNALREACRVQRISFEQGGFSEEADQMYLRERRAYRRHRATDSLIGKIKAISEAVLADFTSRYGTSWLRVIGISFLTITIFSLVYGFVDSCLPGFGQLTYESSSPPVDRPWIYVYYSTTIFTTIGSGDISATRYLAVFSAFQALVGALLIALIIAVFARQWMRS